MEERGQGSPDYPKGVERLRKVSWSSNLSSSHHNTFVTQQCQNWLILLIKYLCCVFGKWLIVLNLKIPDEKIAAPHKKKRVQSGHLAGVGAGDWVLCCMSGAVRTRLVASRRERPTRPTSASWAAPGSTCRCYCCRGPRPGNKSVPTI